MPADWKEWIEAVAVLVIVVGVALVVARRLFPRTPAYVVDCIAGTLREGETRHFDIRVKGDPDRRFKGRIVSLVSCFSGLSENHYVVEVLFEVHGEAEAGSVTVTDYILLKPHPLAGSQNGGAREVETLLIEPADLSAALLRHSDYARYHLSKLNLAYPVVDLLQSADSRFMRVKTKD